jgi:predicted porin
MRYYGTLDADLFGAGSQGLGSLDSGVPNARADNSISYRGNLGAFSGGVNYSFGRDTVNGNSAAATNCAGESGVTRQCREWSAMGKYDGGAWGVVSAYERQYGGTAATFGGLTSPDKTDTRFTVNGYMKVGDTRLGAGWVRRTNDGIATPRSNLYWVVGSVPVATVFSVDTMLAELKYEDSPNRAVLFNLRGNYFLSKRTTLYVSTAFIKNRGTLALTATTNSPATAPNPGGSQNSVFMGVKHTF